MNMAKRYYEKATSYRMFCISNNNQINKGHKQRIKQHNTLYRLQYYNVMLKQHKK